MQQLKDFICSSAEIFCCSQTRRRDNNLRHSFRNTNFVPVHTHQKFKPKICAAKSTAFLCHETCQSLCTICRKLHPEVFNKAACRRADQYGLGYRTIQIFSMFPDVQIALFRRASVSITERPCCKFLTQFRCINRSVADDFRCFSDCFNSKYTISAMPVLQSYRWLNVDVTPQMAACTSPQGILKRSVLTFVRFSASSCITIYI